MKYNGVDEVTDFFSDVLQLIVKLQNEEVDGILLDAHTLRYLIRVLHDDKCPGHKHVSTPQWNEVKKFFLNDTILHQRHDKYVAF